MDLRAHEMLRVISAMHELCCEHRGPPAEMVYPEPPDAFVCLVVHKPGILAGSQAFQLLHILGNCGRVFGGPPGCLVHFEDPCKRDLCCTVQALPNGRLLGIVQIDLQMARIGRKLHSLYYVLRKCFSCAR